MALRRVAFSQQQYAVLLVYGFTFTFTRVRQYFLLGIFFLCLPEENCRITDSVVREIFPDMTCSFRIVAMFALVS